MKVLYTPDEVQMVVEIAKYNPRGFLQLAIKHSDSMTLTPDEVERSMRSWGITVQNTHDKDSGNRSTRKWKKYRDSKVPE